MSNQATADQHVVVIPTKSVGISLILTILFGPLGMLYSTVAVSNSNKKALAQVKKG